MSPLKEDSRNIWSIVVTEDTSRPLMSEGRVERWIMVDPVRDPDGWREGGIGRAGGMKGVVSGAESP
eukprot:789453-Rhodomonas_salina.1